MLDIGIQWSKTDPAPWSLHLEGETDIKYLYEYTLLQPDQCNEGKVQEIMRICTGGGGGGAELVGGGSVREGFPKGMIFCPEM